MVNIIDADNKDAETNGIVLSEKETVIQRRGDSHNSPINRVISWLTGTSLRTKAIAFAIAIGILPILGVGTLTYYLANQSIIKEVTNNKQASAIVLTDNINRFMLTRYGEVQQVANLGIFTNPRLREQVSKDDKQAQLNKFFAIFKNYESLAILNLNGDVVLQTKGQFIPNQKKQDYFQAVLQTKKSYISQPLTTKLENSQIYLAAPIKDSFKGQTIYIVRAAIPLKSLEVAFNNPQIIKDEYHLIDASGNIFLAANKNLLGKNAQEIFADWGELQAKNQLVTRIYSQDLITYVPSQIVEGLPELKWKLVLSKNQAIALANQRQLLLTLKVGTLTAALLTGVLAAILANRLTQPIITATKAVKKLAKGNLNTRISIKGEDEFASLGANINRMADRLQDLLRKQTAESEQLKLFTNILVSIRQSLNSEDLFNITVAEAREALAAHRVVIYHFNAQGKGQVLAESVVPGLPVTLGDTIEDNSIAKELIEAYKKGGVLVANNVFEADFAPEHLKLMEQLQIKATLVTPILKDNQIFGFLIAHHCWAPHVWQPFEINFLRQLAVQVGLTLERVSLLEVTQALKDLAVHMSETMNSQDIYNLAVQDIRQALKVERVFIYKFHENWQGSILAESVVAGLPCALGMKLHDPCMPDFVEKYQQGRVIATNNIYQAGLGECYIQQLESFAVKANIVAPILLGDKLLGLLIAHQCSRPRVWQQSEIDLFEQFARLVGMALERANLLEESEKARDKAEILSQKQQFQLLELLNNIDGVSKGDLTVRAEVTSGEIGTIADFFNSVVESLRVIVTQVKLAATQLNGAIAENSGAIGQLANTALQQAEEISRTLDAVDQMRHSIKTVAKSAKQAAIVTRTASRTAETGGAAMNLTVENILSLRETIGETAKKVKRLGESSQQISRVVSLINQIALQTNLLAINAGIEAARAGEGSQGFAAVAEEVAALAARSAAATDEIEGIVANIQLETSEVVKAMELGTTQVVEGTRLVEDTKLCLHKIFDVCRQIDQLVQSISVATVSQVQTSKVVTNVMKDIAKVSEMTSHSSRQVSASLHKTVEISEKLQASVGTFKVSS
ncbi:MAG: methyl-accepting chemotaxis protein [Heteroscytonema crispum UTEX LB 1556]